MILENSSRVESQDWLLVQDGSCIALSLDTLELPEKPYRLYRFLTELEDILDTTEKDIDRICAIAPRVRKLLTSSYWLQTAFTDPPLDPGWSVQFIYDDYDYPLTIQMVAWLPDHVSPIHNHGTWGLVAIVSGQEKNRFWRRSPTPDHPDQIECMNEKILVPGDILGFTSDAIHSVEPLGIDTVITFNLYGVTDYSQRFEFDPNSHTATAF